ncbi:MAG: FAD-binding protein [Candidatus Dormibacteraeota bacterium]|nr:FAD-binding protein [Candidatus Dormibacteraeota bacterium]
MLDRRVIRDLERQVDTPHVYDRPADLAAYAYDAWGASGERHLPDAVVFPGTTAEVAGVVEVCAYHGIPVVPRGAGTGYAAGAAPLGGGVVLSLARMNRVLGLEPDALRLQAEAGTVVRSIHERAERAGLYYPPDPGSSATCTIGGNVACNAAGPHTLRYGVTADYVAGVTAVLADGRVVRLGEGGDKSLSALLPLITGSEGTLAVITEVLLRLLPAPADRATIAATFPTMEAAADGVAAVATAGLVPAALEFLDSGALQAIRAAGIDGFRPDTGALVIAEVEGERSAVITEREAVRSAFAPKASSVEDAEDAAERARLWRARKAVSAAVAKVMIGKVNEDVVVPRDRVAELVARTRELGAEHGMPVVNFGHLGDGNLHATFLLDPRVPGERERADAAAGGLFETVLRMGGSLSGEHGVGQAKIPYVVEQLGPAGVDLMRRIKSTLDPRGVLNPGKKVPATDAAAPAPEAAVV